MKKEDPKELSTLRASVKVMLSYDYCHFEVALSADSDFKLKLSEVNALRKSAQRLADEAVRQYKVAKEKAISRAYRKEERKRLENEVDRFKDKPVKEWTAEEKAKVKALEDHAYWSQYDYDYFDDNEPNF